MDAQETPASLIIGMQEEREDAWVRFYKNYWRLIYVFAYGCTRSNTDAEDVTQSTFALVHEKIREFVRRSGKPGFRAWLYAICRNKTRQLQRRKSRNRKAYGARRSEALGLTVPSDEETPPPDVLWEQTWYWNIYQCALRRLFQDLGASEPGIEQYSAFCFRCKDGMSYKEIMEYLNARRRPGAPRASVHTIKNHIYRTKKLLRSYIEHAMREYCKSEEELEDEINAFRSFVARRGLPK